MVKARRQRVGGMSQEAAQQFSTWARIARQRAPFDEQIIGYPRCSMLIAENGKGPTAYLPYQPVLMAEAFVPIPECSTRQKIESLLEFDKGLVQIARIMDIGDVYLYVPVKEVDYANQLERKGWLEIENVRLFKKPTGVSVNGRRG